MKICYGFCAGAGAAAVPAKATCPTRMGTQRIQFKSTVHMRPNSKETLTQ